MARAAAYSRSRVRTLRSVGGSSSLLRERGRAVSGETWPGRSPRRSWATPASRLRSPGTASLVRPRPRRRHPLPPPSVGPGALQRRHGGREPVCAGAGCGAFLALSGAQPPEAAGPGGRCYGNRAPRRKGLGQGMACGSSEWRGAARPLLRAAGSLRGLWGAGGRGEPFSGSSFAGSPGVRWCPPGREPV